MSVLVTCWGGSARGCSSAIGTKGERDRLLRRWERRGEWERDRDLERDRDRSLECGCLGESERLWDRGGLERERLREREREYDRDRLLLGDLEQERDPDLGRRGGGRLIGR